MHAGHVGVQAELPRHVGHGDLVAGLLDDGPVDAIPGAVGKDCCEPLLLVHENPFAAVVHRIQTATR